MDGEESTSVGIQFQEEGKQKQKQKTPDAAAHLECSGNIDSRDRSDLCIYKTYSDSPFLKSL